MAAIHSVTLPVLAMLIQPVSTGSEKTLQSYSRKDRYNYVS